jgi:hypothetical protein
MSLASSGTGLAPPNFLTAFKVLSGFGGSGAPVAFGSPEALDTPLFDNATSLLVASLAFCVFVVASAFFATPVAGVFELPGAFTSASTVMPSTGEGSAWFLSLPGGAGDGARPK